MDLTELPRRVPDDAGDGFRLRGREATRLASFVDAAFAFSLTLLVIFFNDLPTTIAELRDAVRRVPTFAVCFVLLMLFWAGHHRWSRRFGLDDARSTVLSLALVLTVMIYVYPLRMVTSGGLSILTAGWVPNELGGLGEHWLLDLQTAFMVYSVGFGVLSWLLCSSTHTPCARPTGSRWMRASVTKPAPRSACTGSRPPPRCSAWC